jgi:SAM-dependent methyltransferase
VFSKGFLSPFLRDVRLFESEWLDSAPPPAAERNLRDLVRINRWFGAHRVLLHLFQELAHTRGEFSVLDVGAASGDMGACLRSKYKRATVTSVDRKISHLSLAAAPRVVASAPALPFRDRSFDFVLCSLVLHHYSDAHAAELAGELLRLARRAVIILELERHPLAHSFLPLTSSLLSWSQMTVHDGCASVSSGFQPHDLRAIVERAGGIKPLVRRHFPWFRISVVVAGSGSAAQTAEEPI